MIIQADQPKPDQEEVRDTNHKHAPHLPQNKPLEDTLHLQAFRSLLRTTLHITSIAKHVYCRDAEKERIAHRGDIDEDINGDDGVALSAVEELEGEEAEGGVEGYAERTCQELWHQIVQIPR